MTPPTKSLNARGEHVGGSHSTWTGGSRAADCAVVILRYVMGALRGAGVGLCAGFAGAAVTYRDTPVAEEAGALSAAEGALAGAAVGAVLGMLLVSVGCVFGQRGILV